MPQRAPIILRSPTGRAPSRGDCFCRRAKPAFAFPRGNPGVGVISLAGHMIYSAGRRDIAFDDAVAVWRLLRRFCRMRGRPAVACRCDMRALPNALAGRFGRPLLGHIVHSIAPIGYRRAPRDHCGIHILPICVTHPDHAAIAIRVARNASYCATADQCLQLPLGPCAARPSGAVAALTGLAQLGGINSEQADPRVANCKRVTINDPCRARCPTRGGCWRLRFRGARCRLCGASRQCDQHCGKEKTLHAP